MVSVPYEETMEPSKTHVEEVLKGLLWEVFDVSQNPVKRKEDSGEKGVKLDRKGKVQRPVRVESTFPVNLKENRKNRKTEIQSRKEYQMCFRCSSIGHYSNECQIARNAIPCPTPPPSPVPSFEPGFIRAVSFLKQLESQPVTVPELLQLRTIIDTLIYFHPTSR